MRGIAALGVVFYHFSDRLNLPLFFAHGYLAVDFFFVLSGFVMASAYAGRLADGRLSTARFYLLRIIRLMPLVLIGNLLAFVLEFWRPHIVDPTLHVAESITALILGCFLLPTPFVSTLQHTLFPLNGPVWSLFFEAIANAVMPAWARSRSPRAILYATILICAVGLLAAVYRFGTIHVGFEQEDIVWGVPRVGFSFAVGIVLYGARRHCPRVPLTLVALILVLLMTAPKLGSLEPVFQTFCVFLALPALTFAAAGVTLGPVAQRVAKISGDLSYPVYVMHFLVVRAVTLVAGGLALSSPARLGVTLAASVVIVGVAGVIYVVYDAPIRRWLSAQVQRRWPTSRAAPGATVIRAHGAVRR